jgi:hypothetical protein
LQVDDIVRHEVHGYGLVLAIDGYDVEVRFSAGKAQIHPIKLDVAYPATHASDVLEREQIPSCLALWLRASDPNLRTAAAKALARPNDDALIVSVSNAIAAWPSKRRASALAALSSASVEQGLPPWADIVLGAESRVEQRLALEAEVAAARRQAAELAAEQWRERQELEQLVAKLSPPSEVPTDVHRRLLNLARSRRGEVQLDALEAVQAIGRNGPRPIT